MASFALTCSLETYRTSHASYHLTIILLTTAVIKLFFQGCNHINRLTNERQFYNGCKFTFTRKIFLNFILMNTSHANGS